MSRPEPVFLQAYAREIWRCSSCGETFRPMVKTQPGWMRLSIIGGMGVLALLFFLAPNHAPWIWLKLPLMALFIAWPVLGSFLLTRLTRPREVASGTGAKVRYGQILPTCTHCGAHQPRPQRLSDDGGGLNYQLDD